MTIPRKTDSPDRFDTVRKILLQLLLCSLPALIYSQQNKDASGMLKQVQLKRVPWPQMSFTASIMDSANRGQATVFQLYLNNSDALVAAVSPASQKGHLLLLQNHELWLYFKSTLKPVKITAIQRLSGSVSYIDIAGINWANDYLTDSVKPVPADAGEVLLYLHAASAGLSYKRIILRVDKKAQRPLQADVYLQSDLLFKTILFSKYEMKGGREINTKLEFIDHVNKEKRTIVIISNPKQELHLPGRYFQKDQMPAVSAELEGGH